MDPKCYHVCWPRLTPERVARVCQHHPSFLLQLDLPLLSSRPTGCHTLVLCLQTAVYNIIKPLSPPDRLAKTLPPIVYDNLPIIYYILWSVYYLTGVPANMTDDSLLEAASRTVQQVFADENFTDFQSRWTFIATWHNVFNYGSTSQNSVGVIVSVKNDMRPMAYICLSVCLSDGSTQFEFLCQVGCFKMNDLCALRFRFKSDSPLHVRFKTVYSFH